MGSRQHGDLSHPVNDGQDSSLVLDLKMYETSAIGNSIVGLPNPDLSMFLPHQREEILVNAAYHLEGLLKRGHARSQASLAPYVAPILIGIEGTTQYPHLEREILKMFKESTPRITVLLALGRQDEARKVAVSSVASSNLETVLGNYELVKGRILNADEFRAVSEEYLLNKNGFNKIGQLQKAHQDRGIELKLRRDPEVIRAVLDDADSQLNILSQDTTEQRGKDRYASYNKSLQTIVFGFVAEKAEYISLARQSLDRGKFFAASFLSNLFLNHSDTSKDADLRGELETLAQEFVNKGNVIVGKKIMDRIGTPFNYDEFYADFIREATSSRELRELNMALGVFGLQNISYALLDAEEATLRKFATDSANLVYGHHADLLENPTRYRNSAWFLVYHFAIRANKKLGNTQAEETLTSHLAQINAKIKDQYSHSVASEPDSRLQVKKTEPKNLGETLLADTDYVDAAWRAYEANGLFGIRDTTQQWVKKYRADEIGRAYDAHPVEILTAIIESKGLRLDSFIEHNPHLSNPEVVKARQAIVEYVLTTGDMSMGIGAQAYHSFRDGKLEIPNPERFAMCIVTDISESTAFSARQMLENAEMFQRLLPGSKVPESLYRAVAAEALREYAGEWFRNVLAGSSRPSSHWYPALESYQKLGHTGLAKFVEVNFAKSR